MSSSLITFSLLLTVAIVVIAMIGWHIQANRRRRAVLVKAMQRSRFARRR